MASKDGDTQRQRRKRGFEQAGFLVNGRIRQATEKRGFAVARLLTHWAEIVGDDVASCARPVNVSYARQGFGATLTVLTTGAHAPILEMQKERIREKVNACYGHNAIARIKITQTAPTGFAERAPEFTPAPVKPKRPDPVVVQTVSALSSDVADEGLRAALSRLGENVLSRSKRQGDTT